MSDLWTELQGMGLIHSPHGSDEFNAWGKRLAMHSLESLRQGLKLCEKHTPDKGKLTLPAFIEYCRPTQAAHRNFKALPLKKMDIDRARAKFDQFYLENPDMCPEIHRERLGLI